MAESAASNVKRGGVKNMLDSLPEIFTRGDLISLRKKIGINKGDTNTVLRQWKHRGYITPSQRTLTLRQMKVIEDYLGEP